MVGVIFTCFCQLIRQAQPQRSVGLIQGRLSSKGVFQEAVDTSQWLQNECDEEPQGRLVSRRQVEWKRCRVFMVITYRCFVGTSGVRCSFLPCNELFTRWNKHSSVSGCFFFKLLWLLLTQIIQMMWGVFVSMYLFTAFYQGLSMVIIKLFIINGSEM